MSLRDKRVLVTRALHQAAPLTAMLRERGAIPLSYPCLEVAPLDNCDALDAALGAAAAGAYDWLLLSSSNSARALAAAHGATGSGAARQQGRADGRGQRSGGRQPGGRAGSAPR